MSQRSNNVTITTTAPGKIELYIPSNMTGKVLESFLKVRAQEIASAKDQPVGSVQDVQILDEEGDTSTPE